MSLNKAQVKLLLIFSLFAIIGFGPISPGCLIGIYIVVRRPLWFKRLMQELYNEQKADITHINSTFLRASCLGILTTLLIIDILPYPVTPSIVIPLIFIRPHWLLMTVQGIYKS